MPEAFSDLVGSILAREPKRRPVDTVALQRELEERLAWARSCPLPAPTRRESRRPLFTRPSSAPSSRPMEEPIPDRKGLFRGDTGVYLATVPKDYEVVQ